MKTTIGNFLFTRLRQMGIGHVFGVPGDFNLQLLEQLNEAEGIEFVGTCNELNASYAADGYARLNGVGALVTTYGVGDLSAVCGIAGACAEHVPVVFLSGAPPFYAMQSRLRLHHSLAEGNFDNIRNCLKEFTAAYTLLTPYNAVEEIDRVLLSCWREKIPVFIQVPSNISYLEIDAPEDVLALTRPKSDTERLESALARIKTLLGKSQRPALLVDADADRCALAPALTALVRKRQIPYAAFRTGKAILSEVDPLYLGIFNGKASVPQIAEVIEHTDCLLAIAPSYTEGSPMVFPEGVPVEAHIYIRDYSVTIGDDVYEGVTAGELIERLVEVVDEQSARKTDAPRAIAAHPINNEAALTHARLWPRIEAFFREGDVVIAENGTSAMGLTGVRLPQDTTFIAQLIWGSIGYTLPALLGASTAARQRRNILFIGDGSFQMTAQELSTILRCGLKPVIFVLNNSGYTIERFILGKHAVYNDVAGWRYRDLPAVFAPETKVFTASVHTEGELEETLQKVETSDCLSLIELHLDAQDAPQSLHNFGPLVAEMDYGPRGPQRKQ
jgi:indolepyruvate decarboxylase